MYIGEGPREEAPQIAEAARQWARNWVACGDAGLIGFQRKYLTPYFHVVSVHGPKMVEQVGGLSKLSGQALEKLNDHFKRGHLRQTNFRDLTSSVQVERRRQIAVRNQEIHRYRKNAAKIPKATCQAAWQGFGAREWAQAQREARLEATAEATRRYEDPRSGMTTAELRSELNNLNPAGPSMLINTC